MSLESGTAKSFTAMCRAPGSGMSTARTTFAATGHEAISNVSQACESAAYPERTSS